MVERLRVQAIAGEDRDVLAERHMTRRAAAPEGVVVHRREIVVDQRIGVDQLERRRQRHRLLAREADRVRGRERQDGPDALAAGQQRVAHRLLQARCEGRLREADSLQIALHLLAQVLRVGDLHERGGCRQSSESCPGAGCETSACA